MEDETLVLPARSWQLRSHQRSLTEVKFNSDGDLLFSACKNGMLSLWRVQTGEKIGGYEGHEGAIFSIDMSRDSAHLVAGTTSSSDVMWDIETGKVVREFDTAVTTKSVVFEQNGSTVHMCTDAIMGVSPKIWTYDVRSGTAVNETVTDNVPTRICITLNGNLIYGDTEGSVTLLDKRTYKTVHTKSVHQSKVSSLLPSFSQTYFITGSDDFRSKILSSELEVIREFVSDSPINASRVSPDDRLAICGGGTNARDVTTKGGKGNFNLEVFDCATTRLVGHYSLHFGTVNTLDIHPTGRALASGAEDGLVNLIQIEA